MNYNVIHISKEKDVRNLEILTQLMEMLDKTAHSDKLKEYEIKVENY